MACNLIVVIRRQTQAQLSLEANEKLAAHLYSWAEDEIAIDEELADHLNSSSKTSYHNEIEANVARSW